MSQGIKRISTGYKEGLCRGYVGITGGAYEIKIQTEADLG